VVRTWNELRVSVRVEDRDVVANFLFDSGASGLIIDDADSRSVLRSYWQEAPPLEGLKVLLEDIGCAAETEVETGSVVDEDWAENWKLHFQPMSVGQRLWICPPWSPDVPQSRVGIEIDPGMAFGTGQHATTRGCLILIEECVARKCVERALDVGTGSGILAIAVARLADAKVWATDVDPVARATAANNVAVNDVASYVQISSDWPIVDASFDLIVANLFTNLLVELGARFARDLAVGGTLVCSGFVETDEACIRATLERRGFTLHRRLAEEGWISLSFKRRG
jgi:ribosomal protein L11 methyltransferase